MSAHHELKSGPETVHWGVFDARIPAVLRIDPGDTVTFHCLSGEPEDLPDDAFDIPPELTDVHRRVARGPGPHFMTGPIWVNGAAPGDVLEVRIRSAELRSDWGWNVILPGLGTLPEDFPRTRRLHIRLDRSRMIAQLPWGLTLPLRPFFGVIGVAPPAEWGAITSIIPRAHGGNLDNKELVPGAVLYLPVWNEGALLSVGDGHAVQGDGEVCLTAIETCLSGTMQVMLRKDMKLRFPRAETPTHYLTMAAEPDLDEAAKQALRDMIALIQERTTLSSEDAYTLCSIAADLRITQLVDVHKGVHVMLPKTVLATDGPRYIGS
jgi:acetamidase/formamidase